MSVLRGPSGNVDISIGAETRTFSGYSVVSALSYDVVALRTAVLQDPTNPDSIDSIVVAPSRGSAVIRSDGNISLDLAEETATSAMSITYTRTTGGVQEQVEATINVAPGSKGGGWSKGRHYLLETDSNDAVIVEPGETTRLIHISISGLSTADIATLEGVSEAAITGEWLRLNPATGHGGLYYGETPELALDEIGFTYARNSANQNFTSPWVLIKRGDTFVEFEDGTLARRVGGIAESRLHPGFTGAYGTGPRPYFSGNGPKFLGFSTHVLSGISWGLGLIAKDVNAVILDDLYADYGGASGVDAPYQYSVAALSTVTEGATIRRCVSLDSSPLQPIDDMAVTWAGGSNRTSGIYADRIRGFLLEKNFVDHAGWSDGYRADGDAAFPKPPEFYSHGAYLQGGSQDVIVRDTFFTRNCHSAMQFRPGGIAHNIFAAGNNTGVNPANGAVDVTIGDDQGNWSVLHRYVQTSAGFKGMWAGYAAISTVAGGIAFSAELTSTIDSIVINAGEPAKIYASSTDIGPGVSAPPIAAHYRPTLISNIPGKSYPPTLGRQDLIVNNWNRPNYPDENAGGVAEVVRDALTIGAYTDALLGASGSDLNTFADHLRTLDAPWELITDVTDYFLGPFGKGSSTRTVAQTVTFMPDVDGDTPGILADFPRDWDTGDLPGHVAGDSINLNGHRVFWNMTPANSIADLTFGEGGKLVVFGGKLAPMGTINVHATGNDVLLGDAISGGGKFYIDGYSGAGVLSIEATESRFLNTGAVAGNISIVARYASEIVLGYDTASFTVSTGQTLDIYGYSKVGFDGDAGGTASLTLAAGSFTRFMPTVRMECDGQTQILVDLDAEEGGATASVQSNYQPKPNAIVTGDTNGAGGITAKTLRSGLKQIYLMLDGLTGVFADNETVSCDNTEVAFFDRGAQTAFATVKGAPEYVLGQINTFRTGINGLTAPNVTTTVTLGGTLHIDVTGLANGDYALIVADTVVGAFGSVRAAGNSAKDLIVTITGTKVSVEVADGAGGVS